MSQKKVSRRKILKTAGLATAAGFLLSCSDSGTPNNPAKAPSSIQNKFEWKLVTTWPKTFQDWEQGHKD